MFCFLFSNECVVWCFDEASSHGEVRPPASIINTSDYPDVTVRFIIPIDHDLKLVLFPTRAELLTNGRLCINKSNKLRVRLTSKSLQLGFDNLHGFSFIHFLSRTMIFWLRSGATIASKIWFA